MKFHRSITGLLAAVALAAFVSGCSNSTSPVDPEPELDTTPPPAVSGLSSLRNAATGEVSLTWQPSAAPDLAGYEVYSSDAGSYTLMGVTVVERYDVPASVSQTTFGIQAIDASGNRSPFALIDLEDGENIYQ